MPQIESTTYHVKTPTLEEVQAVVPFPIDPTDARTAAWYLLGAVYGRDSVVWGGADARRGVDWNKLNVTCIHGSQIGSIALSLSGDFVPGAEDYALMQTVTRLSPEKMLAFLTAALLFQHIDDGTWEPTREAREAKERLQAQQQQQKLAELGVEPGQTPEYDDSSPRVEEA